MLYSKTGVLKHHHVFFLSYMKVSKYIMVVLKNACLHQGGDSFIYLVFAFFFFPAEPAPTFRFFPFFFFMGAGGQSFAGTNKKSKSVEERLPAVRNFHWWAIYQMALEKL